MWVYLKRRCGSCLPACMNVSSSSFKININCVLAMTSRHRRLLGYCRISADKPSTIRLQVSLSFAAVGVSRPLQSLMLSSFSSWIYPFYRSLAYGNATWSYLQLLILSERWQFSFCHQCFEGACCQCWCSLQDLLFLINTLFMDATLLEFLISNLYSISVHFSYTEQDQ